MTTPADRSVPGDPAAPPVRTRGWRQRFWGSPPADDGVIDVWLMSYADMVTLLMTVFVILVLLAGANRQSDGGGGKYDGVRGFLNNIFELRAMSPYADDSDFVMVGREGNMAALTPEQRAGLAVIKKQDLAQIQRRLNTLEDVRQRLETAGLGGYVKAEAADDGLRIDIPDPILFGAGTADIDPRSLPILRALAPLFAAGDFQVNVEGHADDAAVADKVRYPTNWELSAARAATVVRFLADAGTAPGRLVASGYADTRPAARGGTEESRKQNRRVSFLLRY